MNDGLASGEIRASTLSGTDIYATNGSLSVFSAGASEIGAAEIAGGAVTSAKVLSGNILTVHISGAQVTTAKLATDAVDASVHTLIGTGSPSVFGFSVQTGSVTATDVAVWKVFGTAFAAAPLVTMTCAASGTASTAAAMLGTLHAGSFSFLGQSGLNYHWIAIGSGAM